MRRGLWLIRLLLLVAVSAVVFSPLVVHGEASAPRALDLELEYDVSAIALPSSPAYPAVSMYREARLALSEGSCDKARTSLSFSNGDAAAIREMVARERYIESVNHLAVYQQNFDRSVGWTTLAGQDGTNVSSLLARLKNDHIGQQAVLSQASAGLPVWATDAIESSRRHASSVLLEAIALLEGFDEAEAYRRTMAELYPDLDQVEGQPRIEAVTEPDSDANDSVEGVPSDTEEGDSDAGAVTTEPSASEGVADIASMSIAPSVVAPGESCSVSCNVASGNAADLNYAWSCNDGELDASDASAVWTAPSREGTYEISVVVTDSSGNSDDASIAVHVRDASNEEEDTADSSSPAMSSTPDSSASAEILGLSVTADHKYLSHSFGDSYSILVGRSCTITCEVSDPDAVAFEWTANGGELEGEGDTVTWTAPHAVGNLNVTVVVTNGEGQTDTAVLSYYCTTCSQCF